ncbi:restriction endonuclease fold toxin 5 domain-containing protein [Massilia sp. GER05]|uniref:restriction endonuclease fold toxin 5 domain-containing protein n=1 Tax=Massilia sp. GER05 TaxID=3394605 RepID=UPI003F85D804
MAALAVPILEAAGGALLRALGVAAVAGAGAVAVNEVTKNKVESADKAKSAPIAEAGTQAMTKDRCDRCPPDGGLLVKRNWSMSEVSRAYQARISGFAPYTEWNFQGIDFDGFKSQGCLLLEAKALYDQFFESATERKFFFEYTGLQKILDEAGRQSKVIDASPPSELHWYFMQPLSRAYFANQFRESFLPIVTFLTP